MAQFLSVDDIKKLPYDQQAQYFQWLTGSKWGGDQSGHWAALTGLAKSGDWGEIAYQLPIMQGEIQKQEDKAAEYTQRVKEYSAAGITDGAVPSWAATAKTALNDAKTRYDAAPDFLKQQLSLAPPPTYDQLLQKVPAVNPYDTPGGVVYDKQQAASATSNGSSAYGQPITLSNGQKIDPSDPNYASYAKQMGITPPASGASATGSQAASPAAPSASAPAASVPNQAPIPFKAGMTDAQKQGITDLVTKKDPSQWSATDKANWNYATNNAPLPTASAPYMGGVSASPAGSSAPSATGASGSPAGASGPASATPAGVNPQDAQWVTALYQKYFDRVPTSAELSNWTASNPQALEQFLASDAKKYGYTSKYFQDSNSQALDSAVGIIDGSDLPPAIKDLWKTVVKGYPPGMEYNADEILKTFQQVKDTTIDPHYKQLADIAMNDFKTAASALTTNRDAELEQERAASGQNIRQAKEGLEKSGMTFTGQAIQDLGKDSAYAQPGANPNSAVPDQQPFGGMFYEGTVNQGNRLMASSSASRYDQSLQSLGAQAEKQLGSTAEASLGLTGGVGGVAGSLEEQKQSEYGSTLNQIIDNYKQKQNLNTNQ